jgi:hypothetical protein
MDAEGGAFCLWSRICGLGQVLAAELLVAPFDDGGRGGLEAAEDFEELGGIEGFKLEVGVGTTFEAGCADDDDGALGLDGLDGVGEFVAGDVKDTAVENDAVYVGEQLEDLEGFGTAICGEDVEFGSFDDEFAGGDAAGELPVDDEKTWPDHEGH